MTLSHKKNPLSHFKARTLTPFDAEEFREIRLETLRYYGAPFANYHAQEAAKPIEYWEKMCKETQEHCFFGLFNNDELIGVMGARKWEEESNGKTAFWWGNYTKPEYRGLGATTALYQLRIDWTQQNGYSRAMLYVMDGASRPAEIIEKLGAKRLHSEGIGFCGGEPILWHWYELKMNNNPNYTARTKPLFAYHR